MQRKTDPNVWEKKDLRIAKQAIAKSILETYKPDDWGVKEEDLANKVLTYVYKQMSREQLKEIDDYDKEQSNAVPDDCPF